jgi:hypothetical protein
LAEIIVNVRVASIISAWRCVILDHRQESLRTTVPNLVSLTRYGIMYQLFSNNVITYPAFLGVL